MRSVLVTGGAGYIGSHVVQMLCENGTPVVVFDDLSTGVRSSVPKKAVFVKGDLKRPEDLRGLFKKHHIDTVMHLAASISVQESIEQPLKYFANNVGGTIHLLGAMKEVGVRRIIFSSTAAVYGDQKRLPIYEDNPTGPKNPYGQSKLMAENILKDASAANGLNYVIFRYFNAGGVHASNRMGENSGTATHLVANTLRAADRKQDRLVIYGEDYPTPDGTCIRDFVHVTDICRAHLLAMKALQKGVKNEVFNLGSGEGYSVREVVDLAEKITGRKISARVASRREGDPVKVVANSEKAKKMLGWKPEMGMEDIIASAWAWETR